MAGEGDSLWAIGEVGPARLPRPRRSRRCDCEAQRKSPPRPFASDISTSSTAGHGSTSRLDPPEGNVDGMAMIVIGSQPLVAILDDKGEVTTFALESGLGAKGRKISIGPKPQDLKLLNVLIQSGALGRG